MYSLTKSNVSIFLFQLGLLLRFYFITLDQKYIFVDLAFYVLFLAAIAIKWSYSIKTLIFLCLLLFYSMIFSTSDKRTLFFIFVMCYLMLYDANEEQFYKSTIFLFFLLCGIIFIGLLAGISNLYYTDYTGEVSLNLGFRNPNTAAMYFYGFFLCVILLVRKYVRNNLSIFIMLIINIFLNLLISFYTKSRGATICAFAITFMFVTIKHICKYKISRVLIKFAPTIITILLVFLCLFLSKFIFLDVFLTGRLSLYNTLIKKSSLIDYLLGNANIITNNNITIDSAYFRLLYSGGIPCFLLFQIIYYRAVSYYIEKKDWLKLSIILGFLIYGIIESVFTNVTVFTTIIFWVLLYKPQKYYRSTHRISNFWGTKYWITNISSFPNLLSEKEYANPF